jgi:cellobiose phosphorylase
VLSNGDYGLTVSQTGSGYSWRTHAQLNRLTRWEQDLIRDDWGKYIYLLDEKENLWSAGWKPVCSEPDAYSCRHGVGYSVITSRNHGIETELLLFVSNEEPLELWRLTIRNRSARKRKLRVSTFFEWCLGQAPDWHREFHKAFIETSFDRGALFATKRLWEIPTDRGHWNTDWPYVAFHSSSMKPSSYDGDKESFLGMYGSLQAPAALTGRTSRKRTGNLLDPIASLSVEVELAPHAESVVCFALGAADSMDQAKALVKKYRSPDAVNGAYRAMKEKWAGLLETVHVKTPDEATNIMTNTWLKYQAISGRLEGRTAYYQTGGAFGFRDQLQDSQVMLPINADHTRQQLELHARHQFKDGSVYHWWHPLTEIGLHSNITDNLLWLPYVLRSYLLETNDFPFLNERVPYVDDPAGASMYDHCTAAIDKVLSRLSPRGLPLIGAGDWNDGLSATGLDWKGESVWLGHFLHATLNDFAAISVRAGDSIRSDLYRSRAAKLREVLNNHAWDGEWYFRATKDSGEKIGSKENAEGKVFLNAQTWAVIANVADRARAGQVLDIVERMLEHKAGPLLLVPAYSVPDRFIGYLTRYAPGMRENGGVYTHAATWAVIAEAMLGRGKEAFRMLSKLHPVIRGMKPDEYMAEPYVTAGNIEGPDSRFYGRGGWTWYTGSAAWMFKVTLEWILGVRPTFDGLLIDPCIPPRWKSFEVRRTFRGAAYSILVHNPEHVASGVREIYVDGRSVPPGTPLAFPGGTVHTVKVTLGKR